MNYIQCTGAEVNARTHTYTYTQLTENGLVYSRTIYSQHFKVCACVWIGSIVFSIYSPYASSLIEKRLCARRVAVVCSLVKIETTEALTAILGFNDVTGVLFVSLCLEKNIFLTKYLEELESRCKVFLRC